MPEEFNKWALCLCLFRLAGISGANTNELTLRLKRNTEQKKFFECNDRHAAALKR